VASYHPKKYLVKVASISFDTCLLFYFENLAIKMKLLPSILLLSVSLSLAFSASDDEKYKKIQTGVEVLEESNELYDKPVGSLSSGEQEGVSLEEVELGQELLNQPITQGKGLKGEMKEQSRRRKMEEKEEKKKKHIEKMQTEAKEARERTRQEMKRASDDKRKKYEEKGEKKELKKLAKKNNKKKLTEQEKKEEERLEKQRLEEEEKLEEKMSNKERQPKKDCEDDEYTAGGAQGDEGVIEDMQKQSMIERQAFKNLKLISNQDVELKSIKRAFDSDAKILDKYSALREIFKPLLLILASLIIGMLSAVNVFSGHALDLLDAVGSTMKHRLTEMLTHYWSPSLAFGGILILVSLNFCYYGLTTRAIQHLGILALSAISGFALVVVWHNPGSRKIAHV